MNLEIISSTENPQFKHLKKLASSARERRKAGQILLDGMHLLSALAEINGMADLLVIREDSVANIEIQDCLKQFPNTKTICLNKALFNTLSPVESPVGLLAIAKTPQLKTTRIQFGVMLEDIQDPGNLGSILRTAAAAGVDAVFLSKACAEAWSPKALRAGMGAQFSISIYENVNLLERSNDFDRIIATELGSEKSIYSTKLDGSVAFIFGNEGAGVSDDLLKLATDRIMIPMPGHIESLNVAAAAAVCLFERVRQLQIKG